MSNLEAAAQASTQTKSEHTRRLETILTYRGAKIQSLTNSDKLIPSKKSQNLNRTYRGVIFKKANAEQQLENNRQQRTYRGVSISI
ncbi:MAG: hypothetical protein KUG82_07745 [Pseudomonadales bacterium]|nr:hypothetical protein [Pseudomonadales bacterium]